MSLRAQRLLLLITCVISFMYSGKSTFILFQHFNKMMLENCQNCFFLFNVKCPRVPVWLKSLRSFSWLQSSKLKRVIDKVSNVSNSIIVKVRHTIGNPGNYIRSQCWSVLTLETVACRLENAFMFVAQSNCRLYSFW